MVALLLETDDFAAAAWALVDDAGDPLSAALVALQSALEGCGGMAGSDPTGSAWADSYDPAARQALTGLRSLVNGCYRLATMFAQTCRNYAAAEQASTAGRSARQWVELDVAQLPGDCSVTWDVGVPSAVGASSGGPPGWSVVVSAVGRVWPGGHQDRLRAAAAAWRSAAAAVDRAGGRIRSVPAQLACDRLPEAPDIEAVCLAVTDAGERLATSMESLAGRCEELASRLDELHSEVEHELIDLVETSALIEGVGQLFSAVTFGAAEAPTQVAEGWRVSAVAARVAALIDKFAGAAQAVAAAAAPANDLAATVSRSLEELFAPRLVVAEVTPVRTLPEQLSSVDGISRTEMAASQDLGAAGGGGELSRIVEPVDLRAEEAAGGHTIARHVGKTVEELKARELPMASTFKDVETATRATEANLRANEAAIREWMAHGRPKLTIYSPASRGSGVVYVGGAAKVLPPTRICTVLVRSKGTGGWFVKTSYPDIEVGP